MGKRKPDRARQAAVRQAAQERRAAVDQAAAAERLKTRESALRTAAQDVRDLERRHRLALARRDALVVELRAAGLSWGRLALLAGTTRRALAKRASDTP